MSACTLLQIAWQERWGHPGIVLSQRWDLTLTHDRQHRCCMQALLMCLKGSLHSRSHCTCVRSHEAQMCPWLCIKSEQDEASFTIVLHVLLVDNRILNIA